MELKQPKVIVIDPQTGERTYVDSQQTPSIDGLETLAKLMDSIFEIPGTNIRFGLDSIIGLIPGLGDTITSLVSLYILNEAKQRGVSRLTMLRMASNIAVDYVVGSVPVVGDAFDVAWKANQKNVELLKRHIAANPNPKPRSELGDWLFFAGLILFLLLILIGSITIAILIASWIGTMLFAPKK